MLSALGEPPVSVQLFLLAFLVLVVISAALASRLPVPVALPSWWTGGDKWSWLCGVPLPSSFSSSFLASSVLLWRSTPRRATDAPMQGVSSSSGGTTTTSITTTSSSCASSSPSSLPEGERAGRVSRAKTLLRLGSSVSWAVPAALTRRAWKGAAYTSWSVGFEVEVEVGHALLRRHRHLSLAELRQLSADFASDPPPHLCALRTLHCGGVRADLLHYRSPRASTPASSSGLLRLGLASPSAAAPEQDDRGGQEQEAEARAASETTVGGDDAALWTLPAADGDGGDGREPGGEQTVPREGSPSRPRWPALARVREAGMSGINGSADNVNTRVKMPMRRIKSESDNVGRNHASAGAVEQFQPASSGSRQEVTADDEDAVATVLYFHGGGFCVGSAKTYRRCLWHFSREAKGLRFLALDYSLSPNARFPTALRECLHAYLWLIDENGGNVPPEKVILAGDSAGGCLVLALLFLLRDMCDDAAKGEKAKHETETDGEGTLVGERSAMASLGNDTDGEGEAPTSTGIRTQADQVQTKPKLPFPLPSRKTPPALPLCAFLISPWVDLSEDSSVMNPKSYQGQAASLYRSQRSLACRFIDAYLGTDDKGHHAKGKKGKTDNKPEDSSTEGLKSLDTDVRSPYISPLYGDLHGLPPMLLTAGGEEPLLDDIRALHAKCVQAGVEVELDIGQHMNHAYQVFHEPSAHSEIQRSLQAIGCFVWRHIAKRQIEEQI